MKLLDLERKGNVVRCYLGKDDLEKWWGDDWNDFPYELNAGTVTDQFVYAIADIVFPFDVALFNACEVQHGKYLAWRPEEQCKNHYVETGDPFLYALPNATYDCGPVLESSLMKTEGIQTFRLGMDWQDVLTTICALNATLIYPGVKIKGVKEEDGEECNGEDRTEETHC